MIQRQAQNLVSFWRAFSGEVAPEDTTPEDLPNLIAWWDAASLAALLSDNDPVASWTDRKSGLVASQGTAGNRPVLKTNVYNGKPAVRFTAANSHHLTFTQQTFSGDFTWFALFFDARAAAGASPIFGTEAFGASADQRTRLEFRRGPTSEPMYALTARDDSTIISRDITPIFSSPLSRSFFYVMRRSGSTVTASANRGVWSDSFAFSGDMTISSIGRAGGGYFSGDIMQCGYYSRALADFELNTLWAYYYGIGWLANNLRYGVSDFSGYADAATLNGVADGHTTGTALSWVNNWVGR